MHINQSKLQRLLRRTLSMIFSRRTEVSTNLCRGKENPSRQAQPIRNCQIAMRLCTKLHQKKSIQRVDLFARY